VRIREARAADAAAIAHVHVETWRASYRDIVPDAFLDGLLTEDRQAMWDRVLGAPERGRCAYVAEDEQGRIVGFASGGPQRSEIPGYASELYTIYLLPAHQGQGNGRRLLCAVVAQLAQHELRSMVLWVFAENKPARRFYERLGGQLAGNARFEIGGAELEEVAYGWTDVGALLAQGSPRRP
jgi:ribosomal protein S18 acetylase RimI-like enzyme